MTIDAHPPANSLLRGLRNPHPTLAATVDWLPQALLLGLLACLGVDLISGLNPRAQRHVRKQLREQFDIDMRSDDGVPLKYRRTLNELRGASALPIRHGAPRKIRKAQLIALTRFSSAVGRGGCSTLRARLVQNAIL